jgi:dTDP-L-rhamnose 4-epimerase
VINNYEEMSFIVKNVLITGGAGFIGSNLSLKLIEKGYEVTILDSLSNQVHGNTKELPRFLRGRVKFIQGDVRCKDDWRKALNKQDIVVHLAAETGTGQSMYEIEKYTDTNVNGTSNLLEILTNEKHTVKKIVLASSRAIYGEGKYNCENCGIVYPNERKNRDMDEGHFEVKCPKCNNEVDVLPTDERSKIHPKSIYGITKQNQEEMLFVIGKSIGIPVVAFRYQNVYGPGQSLSNPYTGILSIFSTRIKNNNDINIFEDGKESRDFVYIDDVVRATILGIESEVANNNIFNVGSGSRTSVLKIAELLKTKYNSDIKIKVSGDYRLGDIRHNYADLDKVKSVLGFKPQYKIEKGINEFVEWVENQNIKNDNYNNSIEEMKKNGLFKSN